MSTVFRGVPVGSWPRITEYGLSYIFLFSFYNEKKNSIQKQTEITKTYFIITVNIRIIKCKGLFIILSYQILGNRFAFSNNFAVIDK